MNDSNQKAMLITIMISSFLTVIKFLTGWFSGALVLVADSLESLTDIISSVISYIGFRVSKRKPDQKFPYGYYKAENLASLLISGLIVLAAIKLLMDGFNALLHSHVIAYPVITLLVSLLSLLAAFLTYFYLRRVSEMTKSSLLRVSASDRLKDGLTAIAITFSVFLSVLNIPFIQGLMTMILSLLVLKVGFNSLRSAVFSLMDVSPNPSVEKKIREIISSVKGVKSYKDLRLREAGPFIFGQVDISVVKSIDVIRAHEIAEELKKRVSKEVRQVVGFSVHVEPSEPKKMIVLLPVKEENGLNSVIETNFAKSKLFLLVTISNDNIKRIIFKRNPFSAEHSLAGLSVAKFIASLGVDAVIISNVGEVAFHALRDHYIMVYKSKGNTADQVINNFINGKLRVLNKPTKKSKKK